MPKKAIELGPLAVKNLKTVGMHAVGGTAGLCLQIVESGARSWVLRVKVGETRLKMGLGGYPDVSLSEARDKARAARRKVDEGINPLEERRAKKRALVESQAKNVTFRKCAEDYVESHKAAWSNAKHQDQWLNTLETYAYPRIGSLWVRDVELSHVLEILEPIWLSKTPTAKRLRGRIEAVLDSAKTKGYRSGDNPAAWKGNLATLLPSPNKVKKVKHYRAIPVNEASIFFSKLKSQMGIAPKALEFLILTNVRSHNVRHATWQEIDFDTNTWDIPGDDEDGNGQRMKAGVSHRVPLSKQAISLLNGLDRTSASALLFPSPRNGEILSDMAMNKVMRDMKADGVPHGFRSTFRDWAQDHTNFQSAIAEKALAHAVGDQTVQSYLRSDAFNKRVKMMQDWATFLNKRG